LILNEEGDEFIDRFELEIMDTEEKGHDVTFDLQRSFHGVEFNDGDTEGIRSIATYFTNDECGGNPHGFIDWAGDNKDGYAELWLGYELKDHEVKMLSVETEE
jgi:hypothetical protein